MSKNAIKKMTFLLAHFFVNFEQHLAHCYEKNLNTLTICNLPGADRHRMCHALPVPYYIFFIMYCTGLNKTNHLKLFQYLQYLSKVL